MRTGQDTEFIVTEFVTPTTQNAYILVAIQSCKFTLDEEIAGDEEEAKEWAIAKRSDQYIIIFKNQAVDRLFDQQNRSLRLAGERALLSRMTERTL